MRSEDDEFDRRDERDEEFNGETGNTPATVVLVQAFVGRGTLFDSALKNVSLLTPNWIPDGTSNAALFAESVMPVNNRIRPSILHAVIQRDEGTVVPFGWND